MTNGQQKKRNLVPTIAIVASAGMMYTTLTAIDIKNGPIPGHTNPWSHITLSIIISYIIYFLLIFLINRKRITPLMAILGGVFSGFIIFCISITQAGVEPFVLTMDPALIISILNWGLKVGVPLSAVLGLWTALFVWPRWPRPLLHVVAWVLPTVATTGHVVRNLVW